MASRYLEEVFLLIERQWMLIPPYLKTFRREWIGRAGISPLCVHRRVWNNHFSLFCDNSYVQTRAGAVYVELPAHNLLIRRGVYMPGY